MRYPALHASSSLLGPPAALDDGTHCLLEDDSLEHLAGVSDRSLFKPVEKPDFERVDAERVGDLVHFRFIGERHLRSSEPAHGTGHGLVRVDSTALNADIRDTIRAGSKDRCLANRCLAPRSICSAVQNLSLIHI